jgi:phage replication O-like protein O
MIYQQTTQVPNALFDVHLATLTEAELKIFLTIVRKTYGWINKVTGGRKTRDRISNKQFCQKTGMSRRIITKAIQSLVTKKLIEISDVKGGMLCMPADRKGKTHLFYAVSPAHFATPGSARCYPPPVHGNANNKTNSIKTTVPKLRTRYSGHIGSVIAQRPLFEK